MTPIQALLRLLKPKEQVTTDNPKFQKVEWAFQFNNDEPVILEKPKNGENKLEIVISNKIGEEIIFLDGKGNEFKIFGREQKQFYKFGKIKINKNV
jgi:hypothetical protein